MQWKIAEKISEEIKAKFPGLNPVILQLLLNRNITTQEEMKKFLNPEYEDLHNPFLFNDMQKFVERIKAVLDNQEKVFVYGDYDADGVSSSVLMAESLKKVGIENVEVYLPHREKEGYGLNKQAIDFISESKAKLLIAVDCGTSNVPEVAYAKEKGLDVIILDHHEEPQELPKDLTAFLNPHISTEKYPFKNLAAVGVVFKAVQALWKFFELEEGHEKWFLDLVAIATVADMVDLKGENRIFVKYGLKVLNKSNRVGIKALVSAMGEQFGDLGVYDIGFKIAPRLNAAGRLDHANTAYELLETEDMSKAAEFASSLNSTNSARQFETLRIVKEAAEQVEGQIKENKVLVAVGKDWPAGVVGLVSGRITEKYHRPSLVITKTEKGLTGSGRSIRAFNITDALSQSSQYLIRFGGHEGACGFTLKSEDMLEPFWASMNKIADKALSGEDLEKRIFVDAELSFDKIDFNFVEEVEKLAPFGMGNLTPKFASFGARIDDVFLMGNDGQHMRLRLEQGGKKIQAVAFGFGEKYKGVLNAGDLVDIVYDVGINEWEGRRDIQLKIVDIKKE